MALQKFLSLVNGIITTLTATDTSTGSADAGKIVALNGSGKIDDTALPSGVGADTLVAPATEALSAGDFVNIYDNAGTVSVRKAGATDATKPADGFVKVAVASGANATVYFEGINSALTGLTVGSQYFLSTTAGAITATAPSATGNLVQPIGTPHAATAIRFDPQMKATA